jgi:hypothetical protein
LKEWGFGQSSRQGFRRIWRLMHKRRAIAGLPKKKPERQVDPDERRKLLKMGLVGVGAAAGALAMGGLDRTVLASGGGGGRLGDPVFSANGVQLPSLTSDPSHLAGNTYYRSDLGLFTADDGTHYNRINMGFGSYDYYVGQNGAATVYTAYDNEGKFVVSDSTPDWTTLMNSLDALTAASTVYLVQFGRGTFVGGGTFTPKTDTGYVLRGTGAAITAANGQQFGTTLTNSTTSTAMFSAANYTTYHNENCFAMENIVYNMTNSSHFSGTLLDDSAGKLAYFWFDHCTFFNGNGSVSGSIGFSMGINEVSNSGSRFYDCHFLGVETPMIFAGGLFEVRDVETAFCKYGVKVTGQLSPQAFIENLKGYSVSSAIIYDSRGSGASNGLLYMACVAEESSSVLQYQNVNGAYYVMVLSQNYGGNGPVMPVIQTNVGYAATRQKSETGSADSNVLTLSAQPIAQTYRVKVAASVASATSGVIGFTVAYHDAEGGTVSATAISLIQLGTAAPALTFTTSAASDYYGEAVLDVDGSGSNIVVAWVGGGTTAAKVTATIEAV